MARQLYRILDVYCRKCQTVLLKYRKGGKGQLIKCHLHKLVKNFTINPGICQNCDVQWGREATIKNKPALKIIGDRVYWK